MLRTHLVALARLKLIEEPVGRWRCPHRCEQLKGAGCESLPAPHWRLQQRDPTFKLLVSGLLPGWLYNRIPVAIVFRGYNENRNRWKLGLLGIQFVISGLLFSLLYIVNGQYQLMLGLNPGYDYDHVAIVSIDASNRDQRNQCLAEIRRMPNVKDCSSTFNVPLDGYDRSGNMVGVPARRRIPFNIMEMSGVDDNFFKMMNIFCRSGFFSLRKEMTVADR